MINVTDCKALINVDFDDYLKLPGHSFSALRSPGVVTVTEKMERGRKVDAYLFTPWEYKPEADHEYIKALAAAAKYELGGLRFFSQLSVFANFEVGGKVLDYKGRPDIIVPVSTISSPYGGLVVDLKISELDTVKAVQHFRYDWQLTGYAMATQALQSMLLSLNPKTMKVTKMVMPPKYDWWTEAVKLHGK